MSSTFAAELRVYVLRRIFKEFRPGRLPSHPYDVVRSRTRVTGSGQFAALSPEDSQRSALFELLEDVAGPFVGNAASKTEEDTPCFARQ
jgi:hypothetical protein